MGLGCLIKWVQGCFGLKWSWCFPLDDYVFLNVGKVLVVCICVLVVESYDVVDLWAMHLERVRWRKCLAVPLIRQDVLPR